MQAVIGKYTLPEKPTYSVRIGPRGEATQIFEHTEKTLITDEDRTAWAEYEAEYARVLGERQKALVEFLVYNCIDLEPPQPSDWNFDFEFWNIEPPDPEDKVQYKLVWLENDIIPDLEHDWSRLIARLYGIAGLIQEGKTKEFESFFRLILAGLSAGGSGDTATA